MRKVFTEGTDKIATIILMSKSKACNETFDGFFIPVVLAYFHNFPPFF
ncbi:MAG: hypothetical protein M2R45_03772 [Verrucomicrobia subdivision 3 bacterium]|nr:hypothetical protein [Limisphaerales bacterium]MCS1416787.1 hypothetical protein [Limisphaerales bacterium]